MTASTPAPQVWPTLRARDARALIKFLVDAFGFEETVVYVDGDVVHHAQLSWPPGGGIMLGSVRENGEEELWPLRPGTFGAYVVADDTDALFARAKAAGAEVIKEPYDTDYGSHDFLVRDPEGNRWSFGTYRGEPRGSRPQLAKFPFRRPKNVAHQRSWKGNDRIHSKGLSTARCCRKTLPHRHAR